MKLIKGFFFIALATSMIFLNSCATEDPCDNVICPEGTTKVGIGDICECVGQVTGDKIEAKAGFITEDETWTADNIYTLTGKVVVRSGATLTIEPGTIIKGTEGTGTLASALLVERGAKIYACGTADAPIVFTSILDNIRVGETCGTNLDETQAGLWGGLIVLGNAPSSFEGDVTAFQIEGIPADDSFGLYGGTDAADNSGSICYVSIRHGGALIGSDNEINGLTLGGVGNGTTINQVEIVGNLDDGIEFFGGTVNVTNAIVWAQGDDAFDVDQGYAGTLDNFVYVAGAESDHGLEIDGPEGTARGSFNFKNGTLKGLTAEMADFRKGARGVLQNTYFFNFNADGDLELDDNESSANFFNGTLNLTNLEFNTALDLADICNDRADNGDDSAFDAKMAESNATVSSASEGANTTVFEWTLTYEKSALDF